MKVSRTVSYALQATLQLACSGAEVPTPCSQLAAVGRMPERFLLQVLRNLVAHGILQSTRGVDGGYSLVRPPEEISLLEIIEAIEGPWTSSVPVGEGLPEESKTRLQRALLDVTAVARRELAAVTLAHLLPSRPAPDGVQADRGPPDP
jgi:Rrf2 family protein